jgi:peptidoglycan hydrolase-like protein with peptidoglycan-binding domain
VAQPTIKTGSTGAAVKKAQRRLKMRSYDPGPIDGVFGAKTRKAVKQYQTDRGLAADGIVGPATWARLDPPTVKKGSTGDAVKLLQQILKDFQFPPWDPGPVDGDFGAQTEKAVKQFQSDLSLDSDGIVGPETWATLGS